MQGIIYYLALPFIYLISLMPFWLLYRISDGMYILLYYIIGYRKKVVYKNLKKSFPDKTETEIKAIEKNFYKHLCDLMLEILKGLTISAKSASERCVMSTELQDIFKKYYEQKISVVGVMGHWGNWEWGSNAFSLLKQQQLYGIYHPLSNKYFDSMILRMRSRLGTKLIAMNDTYKEMIRKRNEINVTTFIADQTPSGANAYWTTFLNQNTPILWGVEKIAKKMNMPVVFISVDKLKRGYYHMHAEVLTDEPRLLPDGQLTELHTKKLEKDIIYKPEIWLWSHRRWKHKRKS